MSRRTITSAGIRSMTSVTSCAMSPRVFLRRLFELLVRLGELFVRHLAQLFQAQCQLRGGDALTAIPARLELRQQSFQLAIARHELGDQLDDVVLATGGEQLDEHVEHGAATLTALGRHVVCRRGVRQDASTMITIDRVSMAPRSIQSIFFWRDWTMRQCGETTGGGPSRNRFSESRGSRTPAPNDGPQAPWMFPVPRATSTARARRFRRAPPRAPRAPGT